MVEGDDACNAMGSIEEDYKMRERERSNGSDIFGALLIGGAIGAAVGLLTAPRSGRESRKYLKRRGSEFMREGEQSAKRVKQNLDEAGGKLQEMRDDAQDVLRDTTKRISYEGDRLAKKTVRSR